jgi:Domain of unknown function (DUF4390)
MTDSSTPSSKSRPERRRFLRHALGLALGLGLLGHRAPARAADAEIRSASLVPTDELYVLNADISAELSPLLADVVTRGVSLYFIAEFELSAGRWYWLDEEVANKTLTYRLSYQSLTRQYRLTTGALHQNFSSLDEAVRTMLRIRNWGVADRGSLKAGRSYNAALRFRLDGGELPKPIQVGAIGRKDWTLATEWHRWVYTPGRENSK